MDVLCAGQPGVQTGLLTCIVQHAAESLYHVLARACYGYTWRILLLKYHTHLRECQK